MAARWVQLLLCINATLDYADVDLSDEDRNIFYVHAIATAMRRRDQRAPLPAELPPPGGRPDSYRDPTGE